jgi:hypothetical protein
MVYLQMVVGYGPPPAPDTGDASMAEMQAFLKKNKRMLDLIAEEAEDAETEPVAEQGPSKKVRFNDAAN